MRLFVGITPPEAARAHLREAIDSLEPVEGVRWTDPVRWHITLAFLGEVEPERVPRLQAALDAVASTSAAMVGARLSGCGTFGSVVWVGVEPAGRGSGLDRLARATQRAARSSGIAVERKPWKAHLTVGHTRGRARPEATAYLLRHYRGPSWSVRSFTLTHSILGSIPEHRSIRRWDLSAESPDS